MAPILSESSWRGAEGRAGMSRDDHIETGHYAWVAQHEADLGHLLRLVVQHLHETCDECRVAWSEVTNDAPALEMRLREVRWQTRAEDDLTNPSLPEHHYPAFSHAAEHFEETVNRLLYQNRRARRQLGELLQSEPGARGDLISNARKRFRSRALAELLIVECRHRVRNTPREAADLARLGAEVAERIPHAEAAPWRVVLLARAAAHEANALRVCGDLAAADRKFAELGRRLDAQPLDDDSATAEILSLEASLRIGQRHFERANRLLDRTAELQLRAGRSRDCVRTLVKKGNLLRSIAQPQAAMKHLESAAELLDPGDESYLQLCTVTGRVNALCDLERFRAARRLLDDHLDLFETLDDVHLGAALRLLDGRIRLGLDDLRGAERAIASAREAFHALGRSHDADLTGLYLAEVYLVAGRARPLQALAAELQHAFRTRGVERESLACLRLLAEGAALREVSVAVLTKLRRRIALEAGDPSAAAAER